MVFLLIKHKRSNGPAGIGVVASLATNSNGGTANTKMVNGAGDGMRGGRH